MIFRPNVCLSHSCAEFAYFPFQVNSNRNKLVRNEWQMKELRESLRFRYKISRLRHPFQPTVLGSTVAGETARRALFAVMEAGFVFVARRHLQLPPEFTGAGAERRCLWGALGKMEDARVADGGQAQPRAQTVTYSSHVRNITDTVRSRHTDFGILTTGFGVC